MACVDVKAMYKGAHVNENTWPQWSQVNFTFNLNMFGFIVTYQTSYEWKCMSTMVTSRLDICNLIRPAMN